MLINLIRLVNRQFRLFLSFFYTFIVKLQCKSYQEPLRVNAFSHVSGTTLLGKNVNFNGMEIKGRGKVIIGDNFHSGKGCLMITENHNYDAGRTIPYDDTYITKNIIIGDNVWLGDRVVILGGVTIGEGVIIQASSVVVRDIPDYAIVGGHPAKVFGKRDIEHYLSLKIKGKFY